MTEGRLAPKRCSFCGALEGKGGRALFTSAYASICLFCAMNIVNGYNQEQEQKRQRYDRRFLEQARVLGGRLNLGPITLTCYVDVRQTRHLGILLAGNRGFLIPVETIQASLQRLYFLLRPT
jgi:hypothetical protein